MEIPFASLGFSIGFTLFATAGSACPYGILQRPFLFAAQKAGNPCASYRQGPGSRAAPLYLTMAGFAPTCLTPPGGGCGFGAADLFCLRKTDQALLNAPRQAAPPRRHRSGAGHAAGRGLTPLGLRQKRKDTAH